MDGILQELDSLVEQAQESMDRVLNSRGIL